MVNKYRLTSDVYDREREEDKINPLKIYFLSVEGNATEVEYFREVSRNRKLLGIHSLVDVEILGRGSKDTNSAPKQVIELLEEYIRLREKNAEDMIEDLPAAFKEKYPIEKIKQFLDDSSQLTNRERNTFQTELTKIGYDLSYRKYLRKYDSEYDEFCILIDRDSLTHSEANMIQCIDYCRKKGYSCYIANPCFEFWLLFHLADIKKEYGDRLNQIAENKKVSNHHTFVSMEVWKKAGHGKGMIHFSENYLPNVDKAIEQAKEFASNEDELISNIGCNLWKLLEAMRQFNPSHGESMEGIL